MLRSGAGFLLYSCLEPDLSASGFFFEGSARTSPGSVALTRCAGIGFLASRHGLWRHSLRSGRYLFGITDLSWRPSLYPSRKNRPASAPLQLSLTLHLPDW